MASRKAERDSYRDALEWIRRLPCQHPDDPDEDRKMAVDLCRAQERARKALDA